MSLTTVSGKLAENNYKSYKTLRWASYYRDKPTQLPKGKLPFLQIIIPSGS